MSGLCILCQQKTFLRSKRLSKMPLRPRVQYNFAVLPATGFAANGYKAHSPGGYSLFAALVYEIVMIYVILVVILGGATHGRAL